MTAVDDELFLYRTNADDDAWPAPTTRNKDGNVTGLLRLLRRHSPLSRADLVRLSGLTAPTVSAGVGKLQRRDLVIALGPGSSSGGRPPGLLEFNARHGYVIGADIGGSHLRLALADLSGSVVGRWNAALRADRSPKAVTEMLGGAVLQLLRRHRVPAKKVLELVAGAPGITNVKAGRVLSAPNLTNWHDVPFRDLLQSEAGIPTTIENDVNLGALGESWQGAARGFANFVFLAVGTGVGAGVVVNNMLHHGANWSAGEVGYMLLPGLCSDSPTADNLGALESAVGGKSIERAWAELDGSPGSEKASRATDVFDRAAAGDQKARSFLHHIAEQLAMAVTNLSLVLDLSLVVLSGGVGSHEALLQAMRRRLERNEFARPQLVKSSLRGEAQIYGAIWLGLQVAHATGFRRRPIENGAVPLSLLELAGERSL
jgi:glucokinase